MESNSVLIQKSIEISNLFKVEHDKLVKLIEHLDVTDTDNLKQIRSSFLEVSEAAVVIIQLSNNLNLFVDLIHNALLEIEKNNGN